jgi:hypothetical protein
MIHRISLEALRVCGNPTHGRIVVDASRAGIKPDTEPPELIAVQDCDDGKLLTNVYQLSYHKFNQEGQMLCSIYESAGMASIHVLNR